jgi:hypothetical protein
MRAFRDIGTDQSIAASSGQKDSSVESIQNSGPKTEKVGRTAKFYYCEVIYSTVYHLKPTSHTA